MQKPQPLIRNDEYLVNFESWKSSSHKVAQVGRIRESYESELYGYGSDLVDVIRKPTYHMLVIHGQEDKLVEFRFLMDHFRERMLEHGYVHYLSDERQEVQDGGSRKIIERHYIKPNVYQDMMKGNPVDRQFGNITLELFHDGRIPDHLKLTAAYYHERGQQKEKGLDQLMELLLRS